TPGRWRPRGGSPMRSPRTPPATDTRTRTPCCGDPTASWWRSAARASPSSADRHSRSEGADCILPLDPRGGSRSEEHTSELQSRFDLVCRLLLEKKKRMDESERPRGEEFSSR